MWDSQAQRQSGKSITPPPPTLKNCLHNRIPYLKASAMILGHQQLCRTKIQHQMNSPEISNSAQCDFFPLATSSADMMV